jgi:hypothetical protein
VEGRKDEITRLAVNRRRLEQCEPISFRDFSGFGPDLCRRTQAVEVVQQNAA